MTDPRSSVRNRHDPNEPVEVVARLKARTTASGKTHWFGFCSKYKWLVFESSKGIYRLCRQPLAPKARAAVPQIMSPATQAEQLERQKVLAKLHEPQPFVSGLAPDRFGRRRR